MRGRESRYTRSYLVIGLPRSGTTWLSKILQICTGGDLYFEPSHRTLKRDDSWIYDRDGPKQPPIERLYEFIRDRGLRDSLSNPQLGRLGEENTQTAVIKEINVLLKAERIFDNCRFLSPVMLLRHPLVTARSQFRLQNWVEDPGPYERADRFHSGERLDDVRPTLRVLDILGVDDAFLRWMPMLNRTHRGVTTRFQLGYLFGLLHRYAVDTALRYGVPIVYYERLVMNPVAELLTLFAHSRINIEVSDEAWKQIREICSQDSEDIVDYRRVTALKILSPVEVDKMGADDFMHGYHQVCPELYSMRTYPDFPYRGTVAFRFGNGTGSALDVVDLRDRVDPVKNQSRGVVHDHGVVLDDGSVLVPADGSRAVTGNDPVVAGVDVDDNVPASVNELRDDGDTGGGVDHDNANDFFFGPGM